MKRSEMVLRLAQFLWENQGGTTFLKLSEKILDMIEKEGMKPPKRTYQHYYDYNGIPEAGNYEVTDNYWEPENE